MTADASNQSGNGRPPGDRVQTMAMQGVMNKLVLGMLSAPLLSRGIGKKLVTLYVVGRKSGKRYTVPVAYTEHDGALVIGTPFGWGRNLRTGEPLDVRYKGKRRTADVEVFTDEPGVLRNYDIMVRDNKNFAKFNKVGFDQAGNPNPEDMHLAWAGGARAFRLTLR